MKLRFHLSLCNHDNKLKDVCSKILHKASIGIRNEIIKALEKEIRTLKTKRNHNSSNIRNKTTRENYKLIKKVVAEKVVILERKIKSRQVRKISRDNIQPTRSVRKRNRRFKKNVIVEKRKEKRKRYRSKKKQIIKEIKQNAPDQNDINLSKTVLSEEQKSLLKKGPSFVLTPTHINWYEVRKHFTKFTNKVRHIADLAQQQEQVHSQVNSKEATINENNFPPGEPPPKINPYQQLYRSKPSTNNSVELFIKSTEKGLFNPNNIKKARNNFNKEEKLALKEMKSWNDKVIRVQDKGSRFVVLDTNSYIEKVEHQINRSSFDKLDADPSPKFKEKVNNWLEKWSHNITNEWKEFVRPDNCNAGKMYGMVKTYKADNPMRVITSGCNTVVEKLSILVEKNIISIS